MKRGNPNKESKETVPERVSKKKNSKSIHKNGLWQKMPKKKALARSLRGRPAPKRWLLKMTTQNEEAAEDCSKKQFEDGSEKRVRRKWP